MKGYAHAKINLHLHITDRADNGYHHLDSLVAFTSLHDEIRIKSHQAFELTISGNSNLSSECAEDDNLINRACRLLAEKAGVPPYAAIELIKNIPLAAGLGGGSADAAITLLMLRDVWGVDVSDDAIRSIAAELGSDIVACLEQKPVIMRGTGNHLMNAPQMPLTHALLVNPQAACPTPQVYKTYKELARPFSKDIDFPSAFQTAQELCGFLRDYTRNDLTEAAIQTAPVIKDVLNALEQVPHQLLTRLSGSGTTCFALFETKEQTDAANDIIKKAHPDWWTFVTFINDR